MIRPNCVTDPSLSQSRYSTDGIWPLDGLRSHDHDQSQPRGQPGLPAPPQEPKSTCLWQKDAEQHQRSALSYHAHLLGQRYLLDVYPRLPIRVLRTSKTKILTLSYIFQIFFKFAAKPFLGK